MAVKKIGGLSSGIGGPCVREVVERTPCSSWFLRPNGKSMEGDCMVLIGMFCSLGMWDMLVKSSSSSAVAHGTLCSFMLIFPFFYFRTSFSSLE